MGDFTMWGYDQELLGAPLRARRAMDSRSGCHGTAEAGLPCVHRMKALVISIWGLCTTEREFRVQVPVSPMGWRLDHTELEDKNEGVETSDRKGRGSDNESRGAQLPKKQVVSQNGGGLGGVPQCRNSESTNLLV
ncbi:hypothetical protein BHE74_00013900 [Ensete ventricosum]|nr:hypothetical protein BHE74_00013900 [Ensete ventricosum]